MSTETNDEEQAERERALVRTELERKQKLAGKLAKRGLHAAASAPTSAAFGFLMKLMLDSWLFFALGMFFATITFVAGAVYCAGNTLARRGFTRQLRALDEGRQLPEARVVVR